MSAFIVGLLSLVWLLAVSSTDRMIP